MNLYRRVEIAFWVAFVQILTNRKALQRLAAGLGVVLLFSLLTAGLFHFSEAVLEWTQAGMMAGDSGETITFSSPGNDAQANLLLVLADELTGTQPRLEGLWLVIFQESLPKLIFLPILPSPETNGEMESLQSMFHIQADSRLAEDFIEAVRLRNIRLDGYALMDRMALLELLQLSGGGLPVNLDFSTQQPLDALVAQARILNALCVSAPQWMKHLEAPEEGGLQVHFVLMYGDERLSPHQLRDLPANWSCEVPGLSKTAFTP